MGQNWIITRNKRMINLLLVKEKCYWNTKWIEELHMRDLYVNNAPTQQKFALQ
jgi:hypothetical protein